MLSLFRLSNRGRISSPWTCLLVCLEKLLVVTEMHLKQASDHGHEICYSDETRKTLQNGGRVTLQGFFALSLGLRSHRTFRAMTSCPAGLIGSVGCRRRSDQSTLPLSSRNAVICSSCHLFAHKINLCKILVDNLKFTSNTFVSKKVPYLFSLSIPLCRSGSPHSAPNEHFFAVWDQVWIVYFPCKELCDTERGVMYQTHVRSCVICCDPVVFACCSSSPIRHPIQRLNCGPA